MLYALISLMILFWSGNYIVAKFALREFPPLLLVGLRTLLAGVFIAPVYLWERRRAKTPWARGDVGLLLALGVLGVALNQFFFVLGLSRTSVAHSAIIVGMSPILVLLIAAARGLEKITPVRLVGMLVALGGVVLLQLFEGQTAGEGSPTWIGDLLTFGCALFFALFTVLGKPVTKRHSNITAMTFAFVGGAVALSPVTLWESARFSFERVTPGAWAGLIYMALLPSVLCYLIYYYALGRMSPARVSAFSYLQPPVATAMGIVLLSEPVTPGLVAAGVVIFTGVFLTERG